MFSTEDYLAAIDKDAALQLLNNGSESAALETVAQPLHEALYERQTFDFLAELPTALRIVLTYDYVQSQVGQGGFIQLIQNGYVPLMAAAIEGLQELKWAPEMMQVLDDALKVYVLNHEVLGKDHSVKDFAKLYDEFQEFEPLEERFIALNKETIREIITHVFTALS